MNNEMRFEFPTMFQAEMFAEIYEDVCDRAAGSCVVHFDEVPDMLVEEVMLDAQRLEGSLV